MATIYRKTAKGQTEIETRALRIAPRFRSVLILVDGRRTDAELLKLMPQASPDTLEALAQGGFIEALVAKAATVRERPAPVAAASAPAPLPDAAQVFEQHRRESARALLDRVGPIAEPLIVRMERTRHAAELKPLLAMAIQLVSHTRGSAAAADYARRFDPDGSTGSP
jgi:hypothetical protein